MFSFSLNDFVLVWMSLLYEALPFIALGSIISGVVETFVSREAVVRYMPRNRAVGIVASAFLGVLFPMCECGIVPVVRRLVAKGVPASCAITYMLAAPIVHPLVVVSTMIAFRGQGAPGVTLLRVGCGVAVAISVGVVMWRMFGDGGIFLETMQPETEEQEGEAGADSGAGPLGVRVHQALRTAADDFVVFSVFLIGGTAIAAVINSGFSRAAMAPIAEHEAASVAGLMLLAVLLNVCSEADAFIAASFQAFSLPAKLSFIVLGPMLDIKLLLMFLAVFRKRAIAVLSCLMVGLVFLLCVTGHRWMPGFVAALGW
ncbi:MAG: permease [Lentisphaerae bacterium]|jgi:uncharacterized protein|nr:permease [Lentisphaerota bacterium]MBT4819251.1 permease [Lentisphaerota bacterium]MBT5610220.1 permease [Lentisphaerota bacterium]MBT7060040.1 permease [Lentisphaerota bacterium]MBT7840630.1 permease [Lentisphaerota bacterium]